MALNKMPSGIAVALTGMTASVDIPKPRDNASFGRDSLAAVAGKSGSGNKEDLYNLPTPPNSISPNLAPLAFQRRDPAVAAAPAASGHVDSDIDLHDAMDANGTTASLQPQGGFAAVSPTDGSPVFDSTGAITPGLLAKHHLPEILLAHGPLAIRHIMGYLTTSVPGFSGIPPAKARRLVVGALEGRGSGGEGGGIKGNVDFEKVGWGRWDARLKGHPSRGTQRGASIGEENSPPPSVSGSYPTGAMPIATGTNHLRPGWARAQGTPSWAGDSTAFSHDEDRYEDVNMLENEADKMSLDGSCSSSEAPPEEYDDLAGMGDDVDDATDDEDWAGIGAVALREASLPKSASGGIAKRHYMKNLMYSGPRGSSSLLVRSLPAQRRFVSDSGISRALAQQQRHKQPAFDFNSLGVEGGSDALQEREAIEALVRLSSV